MRKIYGTVTINTREGIGAAFFEDSSERVGSPTSSPWDADGQHPADHIAAFTRPSAAAPQTTTLSIQCREPAGAVPLRLTL
jgi:hypothetical protein